MDGQIQPVYDVNRMGYADGGFGGGGIFVWMFLFFFLFAGNGGGLWGGGRSEVQAGFDFNNISRGISGLERGQCDLGYATATQNAGTRELIMNSTYDLARQTENGKDSIVNSIYDLSRQNADCCCSTKMAIMENRFADERGFCNLSHQSLMNTRDITDALNNGFREVKDLISNTENNRLRDELTIARGTIRDITLQNSLYNRLVDRIDPYPPVPLCRQWNGNACYGVTA